MRGELEINKYKRYSLTLENGKAVLDRYTFLDAIYIEISELQATDYLVGTYKGANQFRIDYTKIGRYECEFLDHTFSYRGENEVTILTTTETGEWVVSASLPTNVYYGCAIIIEYDKLDYTDKEILLKFGVDIGALVKKYSSDSKWFKVPDDAAYNKTFIEMYMANERKNSGMIFIKALELLVLLSSQDEAFYLYPPKADYLPSEQVDIIRKIQRVLLEKYNMPISFKNLSSDFGISYSRFNSAFKMIYGDTPYKYLKKVRMNIAAQKLIETDWSVTDIANAVGYNNVSKFASAFKSVIGELPHLYRK